MMKMVIVIVSFVVLVVVGVVYFHKRQVVRKEATKPKFSVEERQTYNKVKQAALERVLGPMYELVGHAIVAFEVGGAVDMYYFPHGIPGTGFATMELLKPDGSGPRANRTGTFELVAFTKHTIPPQGREAEDPSFDKIERRICGIFTRMGNYSFEAVLNPEDTCEIPGEDGEPSKCLIFDEYAPNGAVFEINGKRHCLLLCLEVFRSEMEYAMKNGSEAVLEKLKQAGYYPYSDLDREPVY